MKHALVQWSSARKNASIVTEDQVLDKTMLYDSSKEGMIVAFTTKQAGNDHMEVRNIDMGRVLYVSEDKQSVQRQQKALFPEGNPSQKRSNTDAEDLPQVYTKKAKMPKDQENNHIIQPDWREELKERTGKLQEKVRKLENQLEHERNIVRELQQANLTLQNDLPRLLEQALQSCPVIQQLQARLQNGSGCCQNNRIPPQSTTPEPTYSCERVMTPACRESASQPTFIEQLQNGDNGDLNVPARSPAEVRNVPTMVSEVPNIKTENTQIIVTFAQEPRQDLLPPEQEHMSIQVLDKVQILENSLHPSTLQCVSQITRHKKLTSALMRALFERSVLASSTVTGKNRLRPALDKEKVEQIIAYVKHRFPDASVREIKATMAQKCKDTRLRSNKPTIKCNSNKTV